MAHVRKQVINARVVIAGASETSLACLEHLLLQPHLRFTSLTLLAPGGLPPEGVASQLPAARVRRLGLQAHVTLVGSHMVALEAQERVVLLADGGQLQYDLLLVTTGLQDQLSPALMAAFPDAAHFVLSAEQLAGGSISPEVAVSLASVLVYGADLAALETLAALTEAGVNPDALTWVCPGTEQEAPSLPLLHSLASKVGLELPQPQQGRLLGLTPTADGARAVAALQALEGGDDGPVQQMELDLLVGCGKPGPSAMVASCLARALLVWDGRLVVDARFGSNDEGVLGAGPVAKFSRRYTLPEVYHEHYNSCELGAGLAEAVLARVVAPRATPAAAGTSSEAIMSSAAVTPAQQDQTVGADQLPRLQQGKVVACRLPGGYAFALAGSPASVARPQLAASSGGGCRLISTSAAGDGVVSISINACDVIQQVAYVGQAPQRAARLAGLVGLPLSYIAAGLGLPDTLAAQLATQLAAQQAGSAGAASNGLEDEAEGADGQLVGSLLVGGRASVPALPGLQPSDEQGVFVLEGDVLAALDQPWAQLLFHEDFERLRQQLLSAGGSGSCSAVAASSNSSEAMPAANGDGKGAAHGAVQLQVLDLMQRCHAELPGYRVLPAAAAT